MKLVKEYLDKFFIAGKDNTITLKENGHYRVMGGWVYENKDDLDFPKVGGQSKAELLDYHKKLPNWMNISINNETIIVGNMHVRGKKNLYHYLQTYEHIPRGEPDENGYYARSTDEEIIRYIDSYYQIMALDVIRDEKLSILTNVEL